MKNLGFEVLYNFQNWNSYPDFQNSETDINDYTILPREETLSLPPVAITKSHGLGDF
jgi:hypothetical protein